MTREEEIQKAIEEEFEYHLFEDESDYIMQLSKFKKGIKWADSHPREGLWDSEKVISFLKEHATVENSSNINIQINGACYHFVNDFIQDLRKAMED